MADTLLIGLSALQAHKRAMDVTSHNIANAATPGYTRQEIDMSTLEPELIKPGTVGRGVQIDSIRRVSDTLLTERIRESETEIARLSSLGIGLEDLELVFNEPGEGGLSNVFNNMFATFQDLSNNPESTALRTGLVQNLQTFTSTINVLYERIENQRNNLVIQAEEEAYEVNRISAEIASLNQQISREVLVGNYPNDMEDQRDRLVRELSEHLDVRSIRDPNTGSVRIDVNGKALVSSINSFPIDVVTSSSGGVQVIFEQTRERLEPGGGSLAALEELSNDIIPNVLDNLDELASTLIAELNALHATGTSHTYNLSAHSADRVVDINLADVNLDDPQHAENAVNNFGIPTAYTPSFTDDAGNDIARNLTLNVLDTATGIAEKYTLRYEPGTGLVPNGRSLNDIVEAINTGRGGGFSVYPPSEGGIDGVTAKAVTVGNGVRLQLVADTGLSIDFSPALDLRPADASWTGGDIVASNGAAIPALADQRVLFEVGGGGTVLNLFTLDPVTGNRIDYPSPSPANQMAINPGGSSAVGGVTITFAALGTYTDGESFSVDFDSNGDVLASTATTNQAWTQGDAGFSVRGRYTGTHSFDPARQWSLNVVSGGTVGDDNNAPVVEFTYYTGPDDARVLNTSLVTLDSSTRPGEQVLIADGVYVIFDAGDLTTGNSTEFTIDNQADQAGILTALGVNGLFSGGSASDIQVRQSLADNPSYFSVASSRSPGDNSNLLSMISVRDQDIFGAQGNSLDDFYQAQISDIAVRVAQTEVLSENQTLVMSSLENKRDQVSGVSIDEEVGMLILQQQAYSAAARLIQTARENIDTLIGILN